MHGYGRMHAYGLMHGTLPASVSPLLQVQFVNRLLCRGESEKAEQGAQTDDPTMLLYVPA